MNKEHAASEWFEGTVVPDINSSSFESIYRPMLVKLINDPNIYIGYYYVELGKPAIWFNNEIGDFTRLIEKWAIINK